MKIAIGSDHAAFKEKSILLKYIEKELDIHNVIDLGAYSSESVDYPEYGHLVGNAIVNNEADKGIILCGSGIGISIAANRIKGIRAALCTSEKHAIMSRKHNDANVLAFGARFTDIELIKSITKVWFNTDFEGGRHLERIKKIEL
tara:strand:- start:341 stop:775 length:435 start_codon:yes stop_codon:yes gene_type:complete